MNLRHQQRGVSLSGLIMACVVIGGISLVAMKLFPIYNEKFKVDLAMDKLGSSAEASRMSRREMAKVLQAQFDVNDVQPVKANKLAKMLKVKGKGNQKTVNFAYEIRGPLFGQLDAVLVYDKTVVLGAATTD